MQAAVLTQISYGGYSSISLGYIGLYEFTKLVKGVSHTEPEGEEFALRVMRRLREKVNEWKAKTNIGFALYGTPAESLCYRFARIDKARFGTIVFVTKNVYYRIAIPDVVNNFNEYSSLRQCADDLYLPIFVVFVMRFNNSNFILRQFRRTEILNELLHFTVCHLFSYLYTFWCLKQTPSL